MQVKSNSKWVISIIVCILASLSNYGSHRGPKPIIIGLKKVWILSIGIDNYGEISFRNCQSDARSYVDFFRDQYRKIGKPEDFHSYLLLDKNATKDSILNALKDIGSKASSNDFFIFNFSGVSNLFTSDSIHFSTYFFPYNITGRIYTPKNRDLNDTSSIYHNLLSLKTLQEYLQLIPATNQLFISEAGPSEKFKTEFIKVLLQNSEVASILNKNRIIMVPNSFGEDDVVCEKKIQKGPINYFVTSLDTSLNIYDIFSNNKFTAQTIIYKIKSNQLECASRYLSYFDVFLEKDFLQQYRELTNVDDEFILRGGKVINQQLKREARLNGRNYALLIGTDNYKGEGWQKLSNPVYDATSLGEVLSKDYGFEVQLLKNPVRDSVYYSLRSYYQKLQPDDHLIVYFAGHGDFDDLFLDDGFIVCNDSHTLSTDPVRNSYIPFSKLKKMINKIPAKQTLLLLDVCHGGVFDEDILGGKTRDNILEKPNMNVLQFLKEKAQYSSRIALSSVGKESAFDGKAGNHSPFMNLLLQVLRAKGQGTNGIVTLNNIYSVLQTASLNENEKLKISPHMVRFGGDALGEFILIPKD